MAKDWSGLPDRCGSYYKEAATTSKLGADMTDERELLAKFLGFANSEYVPNALFDRARALLARQPAAIEKKQAVYREVGVWQPNGSKFMTYAKEDLNGKAMFVLEASKPDPLSDEGQREIYGRSPVEPAAPSVEPDDPAAFFPFSISENNDDTQPE